VQIRRKAAADPASNAALVREPRGLAEPVRREVLDADDVVSLLGEERQLSAPLAAAEIEHVGAMAWVRLLRPRGPAPTARTK
jgi:hypothetical protein